MHLNKEVVKLDEMYHHGILGQKWSVRRFQNKDGTLTTAGQKRLEKKDANKNGIWASGRVAYKKKNVDMV